ncbi:hypothetical protein FA95DRAFT_1613429 [Auriscalpium vulgare]|uniref:Uncharacterized protein n=1 Tax=Auriscalpium vulgare TaxID=40419 RepID=A0ACB8R3Q6_9AGAM|nr:hypothetical protein FA95DRAFT_1613429 [Auriscalpium vulgare]
MPNLTTLPYEILDEIASWIPSKVDITALALTSKVLASVASPRHTQLREITCARDALCLWELLAADASLARNVRFLTIIECRTRRTQKLPTPYMKCQPKCHHSYAWPFVKRGSSRVVEEDDRPMIAAIHNMPNLVSFKWEDNVGKIRIRKVADNQDVWSVLAANTAVEKVIIEEVDSRTVWDSKIFSLSNLVIFKYNMWFSLWEPILGRPGLFPEIARDSLPCSANAARDCRSYPFN